MVHPQAFIPIGTLMFVNFFIIWQERTACHSRVIEDCRDHFNFTLLLRREPGKYKWERGYCSAGNLRLSAHHPGKAAALPCRYGYGRRPVKKPREHPPPRDIQRRYLASHRGCPSRYGATVITIMLLVIRGIEFVVLDEAFQDMFGGSDEIFRPLVRRYVEVGEADTRPRFPRTSFPTCTRFSALNFMHTNASPTRSRPGGSAW